MEHSTHVGLARKTDQSYHKNESSKEQQLIAMSEDNTQKLPSTTRKRCLTADAKRAMIDDSQSAKIRRKNFADSKIEMLADDLTPTMHNRNTDASPWTLSSFWQPSTITTCGIPNLKMNDHPLGLAHVIFDNCVVKVRAGFDLNNLLSLGRLGHVELLNVTSFGWVATDRTLLPCCIFSRWISSMQATES